MARENYIVEKIGGGATATADGVEANVDLLSSGEVSGLVVSGPGGEAGRITDDLLAAWSAFEDGRDPTSHLEVANDKLATLVEPLGQVAVLDRFRERTTATFIEGHTKGWLLGQSEDASAQLYLSLLKEAGVEADLIDPATHVYIDQAGKIDTDQTYPKLGEALSREGLHVIPGFIGRLPGGGIGTLGRRGGSDTTGMAAAAALDSIWGEERPTTYRLLKDDVQGVMRVRPGVVEGGEPISELSITELETFMINSGSQQIVHPDVLHLLRGTNVRLEIKNTFDRDLPGTTIVDQRKAREGETIVAIASTPIVTYELKQENMNTQPGVVHEFTGIFSGINVPILEATTVSGDVAVHIVPDVHDENEQAIREALAHAAFGKDVSVDKDRSLIVLLGEGMRRNDVGIKVGKAVYEAAEALGFDPTPWRLKGQPNYYLMTPRALEHATLATLYAQLLEQ